MNTTLDFLFPLFLAAIVGLAAYNVGKHAGYEDYFKGKIECKQAFELVECKKLTK